MARRQWQQETATACVRLDDYEREPHSIHEQHGFEDGFVDFLVYGGTGNPPTLPPRRYWRMKYQNQNGYLAVQDWYRGFQHGVEVAQASGYRNYITVQTSDALVSNKLPVYAGQASYIESVESIEPLQDATDDQPQSNPPADAPEPPPAKPIPDVVPLPADAGMPADRNSHLAAAALPSDLVAIAFWSGRSVTREPANDRSNLLPSIRRLPPWPENHAVTNTTDDPPDASVRLASFSIGLAPPDESSSSRNTQSTITLTSMMQNTRMAEPNMCKKNGCSTQRLVAPMVALLFCLTTGCAALTNPVLNGIPVRRLPPELLSSPRRENQQTIPLSLLRQPQPEDYILAPGDVLGVFIAGIFPTTLADQPPPPVYFPSQIDPLGAGLPPSLGYPVTIRNDGTLALPLIEPILLSGLTVETANERIRNAYLDKRILQPNREAVLVTLLQPRQIRVLVFRQEVGGFAAGGRGDISVNNVKQGTGNVINLRAYENDVLTALARTGGLPGLDTFDGVYIFRGGQSNIALTETLQSMDQCPDLSVLMDLGVKTDYIPTRRTPGQPLPFGPEDVLLHEGDVVLVEARIQDLYYTGGLLPSDERILPRDYDLDVVEAVAQARGTLINGAFGGNNFTGRLIQQGIGNPNPSALTVIRRTPNGGQIAIRVDLNRALTDPRERILVQADDVLILQESADEAVARYFGDIFNFNIFVQLFQGQSGAGTAGVTQIPAAR